MRRVIASLALCLVFVAAEAKAQQAAESASSESPVGTTCPDALPLGILYKPPQSDLWSALVGRVLVSDAEFTASDAHDRYRGHARLTFRVDSTGVPLGVSFRESTGNRDVDRALIAWGKDFRFAQDPCGRTRIGDVGVVLPVVPQEFQALHERYVVALVNAIRQQWQRPASVPEGATCRLTIQQLPGGQVVSVSADASCAFDQADVRSLEAAVLQAQPLPYAGFESVFRRMLLLNFKAGADPTAK